jgi:hypothetical protein
MHPDRPGSLAGKVAWRRASSQRWAPRQAAHTLAGTLAEVLPALSPQLVGPDAGKRLNRVARVLPAGLTHQIYFECRLSRDDSRVDLIVRVDRSAAPILAGQSSAAAITPAVADTPVWRRLRQFGRCWLEQGWLGDAVAAVWLELDLPADPSFGGPSRPRLFMELRREWLASTGPTEVAGVALAACELVMRGPLGTSPLTVVSALRQVPEPGCLVYVGCQPASSGSPLRLCFGRLDSTRLPEQLRSLCGAEVAGTLATILPSIAAPPMPVVANVELADRVLPGLGLELGFERSSQLHGEIREHELVATLVRLGLCSAEKERALSGWPRATVAIMRHEIWPSLLLRRLNHIKLNVRGQRLVEAKAYLRFEHRFRARPT